MAGWVAVEIKAGTILLQGYTLIDVALIFYE